MPVAVQQHQDTVAVSYAAKALGVRKHMKPADIRKNFAGVKLVHVYTLRDEHGFEKASYQKYHEQSQLAFMIARAHLDARGTEAVDSNGNKWGTRFETSSIDEAYLEPHLFHDLKVYGCLEPWDLFAMECVTQRSQLPYQPWYNPSPS